MKHITILFTQVLSGVFQQGLITSKKRNLLLQEWKVNMTSNNVDRLKDILLELKSVSENKHWNSQLNEVLEELTVI